MAKQKVLELCLWRLKCLAGPHTTTSTTMLRSGWLQVHRHITQVAMAVVEEVAVVTVVVAAVAVVAEEAEEFVVGAAAPARRSRNA